MQRDAMYDDGYNKYIDVTFDGSKYALAKREIKSECLNGNDPDSQRELIARVTTTDQCYQVGHSKDSRTRRPIDHNLLLLSLMQQVSSTTNNNTVVVLSENLEHKSPLNYFANAKYKNQIIEKYLRGLDDDDGPVDRSKCDLELSKWIESAVNFTPEKNNYIEWESRR